jgi:hypothetical protein
MGHRGTYVPGHMSRTTITPAPQNLLAHDIKWGVRYMNLPLRVTKNRSAVFFPNEVLFYPKVLLLL